MQSASKGSLLVRRATSSRLLPTKLEFPSLLTLATAWGWE